MAFTSKDLVTLVKKHPVAIGCGALSLILLAGSYLRGSRASELADQLKQKEQEGQKILDDIRNGANLVEQYDALTATTKELDARLVRSSERARNQQYFYRLESDTGVTEISLLPGAVGANQPRAAKTIYTSIGYNVSVQGDFREILDFIGRLESGQHFFRLVSGTVAREGARTSAAATAAVTLTLNLEFLGLP
jgi:hypothetical protein